MPNEPLVAYMCREIRHGFSVAETEALIRIVVEDVFHLSFAKALISSVDDLKESDLSWLEENLPRLANSEPIQYILKRAVFCGLDFEVNPDVLIPRPETEELVRLVQKDNPSAPILDACTGSGCIAISLAHLLPQMQVAAFDISEAALGVAKRNAQSNGVDVDFFQHDLLKAESVGCKYGTIVCNPPYVMEKEKKEMDSQVLCHEPAMALFVPDEDPLLFYRALVRLANEVLAQGGAIYCEINAALATETSKLFEVEGYTEVVVMLDSFNRKRFLRCVKS